MQLVGTVVVYLDILEFYIFKGFPIGKFGIVFGEVVGSSCLDNKYRLESFSCLLVLPITCLKNLSYTTVLSCNKNVLTFLLIQGS